MNKAWLRENFFIFRITRLFRASPCFTFANPRIYWGFSSSTTDPRHFLVENFKRCGFCSLKETVTWHIHNLMLPNDIFFDRTNRTVFCMYLLLHLRYFSHILTSPSKAPIFHIRLSVENGGKSSRFDNFFCFSGWVSQGDELHQWIQIKSMDFPQRPGPFFIISRRRVSQLHRTLGAGGQSQPGRRPLHLGLVADANVVENRGWHLRCLCQCLRDLVSRCAMVGKIMMIEARKAIGIGDTMVQL